MPTEFNLSDVFISYSRKDNDFVHQLDKAFKAQGREVWVDWEDIPLTANWWAEIQAGIDGANSFVFIISPDSVTSPICRDEVEHAVKSGKRILPVLHREVTDPEQQQQMHPALSSHNWIMFQKAPTFEDAFTQLLGALDTDLDHVRAHTRYMVRANEWESEGQSPHLLLTGRDIQTAEAWLQAAANKSPVSNSLQEAYIKASRRAARNRRFLIGAGLVTGTIITILMIIAFALQQEAQAQREAANDQRVLAEREADVSDSLRISTDARLALNDNRTTLALALALEAVKIVDPPQTTIQTLMESGFVPGLRREFVPDLPAWSLAVSSDASEVFLGLQDGRILVQSLADNAVVNILEGHQGLVIQLVVVPASDWLLSASYDDTIRLWNYRTGQWIRTLEGHTSFINDMALLPDNRRLASVDDAGETIIWDIETGEILQRLEDHTAPVTNVAASEVDDLIATTDLNGAVIIRDTSNWQPIQTLSTVDLPTDITFLLNWLAIGDANGDIVIVNPRDGSIVNILVDHLAAINTLHFDSDALLLTSGDDTGTIYVYDVSQVEILIVERFNTHESYVRRAFLMSSIQTLLSIGGDGILHEIDLTNAAEVARVGPFVGTVTNAIFSPDGQRAYIADYQGGIAIADTANGEIVDGIPESNAFNVALTADGTRLAILNFAEAIIYDTNTLAEINRFAIPDLLYITIAYSADGRYIAGGDNVGQVTVIDAEAGEILMQGEAHTGEVFTMAFSPAGDVLYTGGRDGFIRGWAMPSGELVQEYDINNPVTAIDLNSDGSQLLIATQNGQVTLWDVATGTQLDTLVRTSNTISYVFFTAGDTEIVTGSIVGFVRVWAVDSGTQLLSVNTLNVLRTLAVTDDGTKAIVTLQDESVRIYDLTLRNLDEVISWVQSNRFIREFSCEERIYYQLNPLCGV